jgi:WD40 repeat protein
VAFSGDGRLLAGGDWGGVLLVWEATSGRLLATGTAGDGRIHQVAFGPGDRCLATVGVDGVLLWRLDRPAEGGGTAPVALSPPVVVTNRPAGSVCFSPEGAWLAWVEEDRTVHVRDLAGGGSRTLAAARSTGEPYGLAFLPDGRRLIGISELGVSELWDVATGQPAGALADGGTAAAHNPTGALSPDGAWWARGRRTITLWDVVSGRRLLALPEEQSGVYALAWSPDGARLAVGTADGGLAVWSLPAIRVELARLGLDW